MDASQTLSALLNSAELRWARRRSSDKDVKIFTDAGARLRALLHSSGDDPVSKGPPPLSEADACGLLDALAPVEVRT